MTNRRTMRVHLVHQSFPDYMLGLSNALNDRVELTLTSLLSGSAVPPQMDPQIRHQTRHMPRFRSLRSPVLAWRSISKVLAEPTDLLHWQAAGNPWVDAIFSFRIGKRPFVLTVHDMHPHPGDSSVLPGTFWAIHRLVHRARHVIVHALSVRDQAIALGVDPEQVSIVPHGELGTVYSPSILSSVDTEPKMTVLFFGRVQGYKGLPDLIEAMSIVRESLPMVQLRIAGAGKSTNSLKTELASVPNVTVEAGFVPNDSVADLFRTSAVIVLPYREASQSGVAALAAGLGRAVVATRVGGLAEIVEDGVSGLLVDPKSPQQLAVAISSILSDTSLRRRLETGASNRARGELSWSSIAERTVELYSLVERGERAHESSG